LQKPIFVSASFYFKSKTCRNQLGFRNLLIRKKLQKPKWVSANLPPTFFSVLVSATYYFGFMKLFNLK